MVPKGFAQYANKIINGISCLYLAENKIMAEPQDIKHSKNIKNSKFYELADEKPEVCGHNQLPLSYEIDETCD